MAPPTLRIKWIKWDDGKTPTNEELLELIKPNIPEPIKWEDWKDGKDGIDWKDGRDWLDWDTPKVDYDKIVKKTLKEFPKEDLTTKIAKEIKKLNKDEKTAIIEIKDIKGGKELLKEVKSLWNFTQTHTEYDINDTLVAYGKRLNLKSGTGITLTGETTANWADITIASTPWANAFTDLTDTFPDYTWLAGQWLRVNATEDGIDTYTPTDTDEKVKLNASDPTAGYLDDKIGGYGFLTAETDPLSLHLDQTTPQTIENGVPLMTTEVDGEGSQYQLINKEYVDNAVSSLNLFEFFHNEASDIGGIYYLMNETEDASATVVSSAVPTGASVNIFNFATPVGSPNLNRLVAGVYHCHFHAYRSASVTRTVKVYWELYQRTSGGTETLLGASEIMTLSTTSSEYEPHLSLASEITLLTTDRLVIKWWATVTGAGGSNPTVTFDVWGANNSHFAINVNPASLGNLYVKLDQTTAQTITASPVLNWLTASELVATDANKKLQSLAVATYPSLAELARVKWLTSSVQTQLDGKLDWTLTAWRIPFASDSNTLIDEMGLSWDSTLKALNIYGSLWTEKVTNGTFGSSSWWTLWTGWTISWGTANHASNGTWTLSQSFSAYIWEIYTVSFTMSGWTVGTVSLTAWGVPVVSDIGANGTYTYKFVATTTWNVIFTPTNTARFSLDNVSIKKMSGGKFNLGGNATLNGNQTISFNNSYYIPGSTTNDHLALVNSSGSYSHISFKFGTFTAGSITDNYSGGNGYLLLNSYGTSPEVKVYTNGTEIISFAWSGTYSSQSMTINNTLAAWTWSINPQNRVSLAHSQGRSGTIVTANSYTPNAYDYIIYCDTTFAQACTGTPSTNCAGRSSESDCILVGCAWSYWSSCSVYDYDISTCSSTSGCYPNTGACSDGNSDQYTCENLTSSYWGSCSWDAGGVFQSCSGDYSSWCTSWNWYTASDCSSNSGGYCEMPSGDYWTCQPVWSNCAWLWTESLCLGYDSPYISWCSASYSSSSCTGSGYNTWTCWGTYGSGCSWTAQCGIVATEWPCNSVAWCTWSSAQNINLPQGSAVTDSNTVWRVLYIKKVRGSGNVTIVPYSGDDIDGSFSYTISTLRDSVQLHYFRTGVECNYLSTSAACTDQSGCSWITCSSLGEWDCSSSGCTWDSETSTCSGSEHCSWTAVYTKRWHVLSQKD